MMLGMLFFLMADASGDEAQVTEARVKFIFENEVVYETIKSGCLKTLDDMMGNLFGEKDQAGVEIELPMHVLSTIKDKEVFARFKALWCESEFGSREENINADDFVQFFGAADFWELCGESLQHFTESMVKRGLLGKYSSDIISTSPYNNDHGWKVSRKMLVAFAEQIDLKVRVCDEEMRFYSADDCKAEDCGKAASEFEEMPLIKKVSLRCRIPVGKSRGAPNRAAIFGWLLCHASVSSSLYVGSELVLETSAVEPFNSELSSITKEHGSMRMVTEGLDLDLSNFSLKVDSINGLMKEYSDLKELNVKVSDMLSDDTANCFSNCKKLEKLRIRGSIQSSSFIEKLLEKLPEIKELDIQVDRLDDSAADSLSNCKKLKKLKICGMYQSNSFIRKLVEKLLGIRELYIETEALDDDIADSLSNCKRLGKLRIDGQHQRESFIRKLVEKLFEIEELDIKTSELDDDIADSFSKFKKLKKLSILGESSYQSDLFVKKLLKNLSKTIETLEICAVELEIDTADSLSKCEKLENLHIEGIQNGLFFEKLVEKPLGIRCLDIQIGKLSNNAIDGLSKYKKLEKLKILVRFQKDPFVRGLVEKLPEIRELSIEIMRLKDDIADSFLMCKRLEKLSIIIFGVYYGYLSNLFVKKLVKNISKTIRELNIDAEELEDAIADGFSECSKLEMLKIYGIQNNSFIKKLPKIKNLWISH